MPGWLMWTLIGGCALVAAGLLLGWLGMREAERQRGQRGEIPPELLSGVSYRMDEVDEDAPRRRWWSPIG